VPGKAVPPDTAQILINQAGYARCEQLRSFAVLYKNCSTRARSSRKIPSDSIRLRAEIWLGSFAGRSWAKPATWSPLVGDLVAGCFIRGLAAQDCHRNG